MVRPFAFKDVRKLISEYKYINYKLKEIVSALKTYKDKIKNAVNELAAVEALSVLQEVPIQEINRHKSGFRLRPLINCGFTSIKDVVLASEYTLASIRGISSNTAREIKNIANKLLIDTLRELKISISADNKTKEAAKLIVAISKYKNSVSCANSSSEFLQLFEKQLDHDLKDIKPAKNVIRWFFASKDKRSKAVEKYNKLYLFYENEFKDNTKALISEYDKIKNFTENYAWSDFEKDSIKYYNILEEIAPEFFDSKDSVYGLPEEIASKISTQDFSKEGLLCELRRYQEWGVRYILNQKRVLLGDEMGLGKTVQAIATMVALKNKNSTHFVVVCPASVIENWCREINKHSRLNVKKVHGNSRKRSLEAWIDNGGVAVTTYETTGYFKLEAIPKINLIVVDEAHYIKNPNAKRTINTKNLCSKAEQILFMTGTPLENKVDEMISLISILQPRVANSIMGMESLVHAPHFRKKIAPVYYRRKREDVLGELPKLIETREWCTLGIEERIAYEKAVLSRNFMDIRRVSWSIDNLRNSSKAKRMLELINEAKENGRKILIFSFFLDTIKKIKLMLGNMCLDPISGKVSPENRQKIIDDFNESPAGTVLVAQIQSGGIGLNIQSASVVIICEPQLKPSIENQAISRAYRMGQPRDVLVYRLLCKDTIDERIIDLLENKEQIFNAFADKSEAAYEDFYIKEEKISELIDEEIKRIKNQKNR
ncbi:DEAD/DEAH box helicase [Deferribacterales bacterium Es71-Z0220]|uniref:DEAD/DEAH box helicase n=1 Tax=Deferrivibrio essentukiensis TaxID=2880922 RepID=UPI001F6034C0|nr:DEAD/DEAH box helicase [Deferrivibrio essentukiensis]MCB4205262.1 DEAD/DEAH box helicase [Deferrivibrio essentukiensis]